MQRPCTGKVALLTSGCAAGLLYGGEATSACSGCQNQGGQQPAGAGRHPCQEQRLLPTPCHALAPHTEHPHESAEVHPSVTCIVLFVQAVGMIDD